MEAAKTLNMTIALKVNTSESWETTSFPVPLSSIRRAVLSIRLVPSCPILHLLAGVWLWSDVTLRKDLDTAGLSRQKVQLSKCLYLVLSQEVQRVTERLLHLMQMTRPSTPGCCVQTWVRPQHSL